MQFSDLGGSLIVLLAAGCILIATIFIVFAKRQITRFTLRSRHIPHAPIGHSGKDHIRKEIERRLGCVGKLYYEPQLLDMDDKIILKPGSKLPPYYYRMKAVDDLKLLEKEIPAVRGSQPLRPFLMNFLSGTSQKVIHQYCDNFEHARYDPGEYGDEEYKKYHHLLLKMIEAAKIARNSSRTSPSRNRTPTKKASKIQALLDPSRLKPPTVSAETRNSQLNLTIGLQQQQLEDENEILSISHATEIPKIEML